VLTITKLRGAEYLIASVAGGIEDYYMGAGEAPGVWRGRWAKSLGLEGVVGPDDLRALVDGFDPRRGADWLAGHRERVVRAIDVTLSCPKSVSLLWAFGTPETSATVSIAVVDATEVALQFLEERAAVARVQEGGVRRQVATDGFAVATFAHRTSRAGDPQLHTHCLIPNIVHRADGAYVAFDAAPLHVWAKAAGTVFLNQLERNLIDRLGVAWGPERNGVREMVGFTPAQLRAFSKRTQAIEAHLEAGGEVVFDSPAERMRADERASLATRARKDKSLTPGRLRDRWADEALNAGLDPGENVDLTVVDRHVPARRLGDREVFAALVDPVTGLCAHDSRFGEAHVVERVAAMSGGQLDVDQIVAMSTRFLQSEHVVRLAPDASRRRPAQWSTVEHRAIEDQLLADLQALTARHATAVPAKVVAAAVAAEPNELGRDQAAAVRALCGKGAAVRAVIAPAGYGKTTALRAAAVAASEAGRPVVVVAPTHKAVAELCAAGIEADTIARFRGRLADQPLAPRTVVVVDELSQVATRDATALVAAVAATPDGQLWCAGDARQAQSVAAGGLAVEIQRLADTDLIPSAGLTVNRRQTDASERLALSRFRAGAVDESRAIRAEHGWEHQHATPADTRRALAGAAVADGDRHGPAHVAVLAVSHADCEDLADQIRSIRTSRGELRGPAIAGPGWGAEPRRYAAGDRVLIHANLKPTARLFNGAVGTVVGVDHDGMRVQLDQGYLVDLSADVVAGRRQDGTPNVSHGWARTVDGAQGGTWAQVHLLGTPTLDRFTGYVGQSRGRHPTHTWNTRADADHPARLLADQRLPSEVVVDAMRRAQPKTFAAAADPWMLDRELRAEAAQHAAVVARRPPDRRHELDAARRTLEHAESELGYATQGVALRIRERDQIGPVARMRRGGKNHYARAQTYLDQANRRLDQAKTALDHAATRVSEFEAAVAARAAWDRTDAWRIRRLAEIDDTLAHHWAAIALSATRADDPLAFGIERLRQARTTYADDHEQLVDALPPDRRPHLARARADLRTRRVDLRDAGHRLAVERDDLDQAPQRRWGRRDQPAIRQAETRLANAVDRYDDFAQTISKAEDRVAKEHAAADRYENALRRAGPEITQLGSAVRDIDTALDRTRHQRVITAALDPTSALHDALGPPPNTPGALAAWCGIAEQIEAFHDNHTPAASYRQSAERDAHPALGAEPPSFDASQRWRQVSRLVDNAHHVIAEAERREPHATTREVLDDPASWHASVDVAQRRIDEQSLRRQRSLGIER
jgi:conjugative relaxase-like TrwC/TraI family protein